VTLEKTIAAIHGENTTVVLYDVLEAPASFTLELRPLIAYRDYHALQHANGSLRFANASFKDGVFRASSVRGRAGSCSSSWLPPDSTPSPTGTSDSSTPKRSCAASMPPKTCSATAPSAAGSRRASASA